MRYLAVFASLGLLASAPACQDDTTSNGATDTSTEDNLPGSGGSTPGAGTDGGSAQTPEDGGRPPEKPARPYVPYDVNHVLSTGQSNAVANEGVPIVSTTQPYANLAFDTGVMTSGSCDGDGCRTYQKPNAFKPLVEGDNFFGYPVETMSSGLANQVSKLAGASPHAMLVSLHGRSGNAYTCLRKGFCGWWPGRGYIGPFEEGMMQVADGKRLAEASGKSYVVRAATAIHGENDHYAYASGGSNFPIDATGGGAPIADYTDALIEWQKDYEAEAKAITGQTEPVPLFINQYSHWNNVPTTVISGMQLAAHVKAPGKVVVVGPTYALDYGFGERHSCLHFTGPSEQHLGEYFAKAYARTVLEGKDWEPLRPLSATRAGNVVTIRFLVPSPPLVIDTERLTDPGNYGFEWTDDSGAAPAIASVALAGADTVTVTLASAPTAAGHVKYASTFRGCSGPRSTARGNLRDSDTTPSQNGHDLFNWSVHFDLPVQ